ncbi:MAG: tRNA (N(6)-L-threonylcarbamoyladenosine(37)-C(2))-methylthiotransferase MtaB [Candidatus Omnitrophica bacterium]|nr:tRNA (N(6)-L-threonylcarbamoyladenosine(37)-C(2))-methylthiotransferase MtaB [Candidatus Omnitrophota bacterium]
MLPTIYFHTFGCRLNQGETSVLEGLFKAEGFPIASQKEHAQIFVINTCTVTAKGDLDTRKLIHQIIRINSQAQIALIGCQSQTQKNELFTHPNIRWVVGNAHKMELVNIIKKSLNNQAPMLIVDNIPKHAFTIPVTEHSRKHTRANIKIQDGCNYFCSYCEVPYARGRSRSRLFDNIMEEAKQLAQNGYKEIILTGVNTGTYSYENKNLLDVIKALSTIPGIERIRISSIEPQTVDLKIFEFMAQNDKLCHHLHTPAQSCNDRILKAMNRVYTFKEFENFISLVIQMVPGIGIGTDIIVGFPGETDEEFEDTYVKLSKLPLSYIHVFSYSPRKLAKSKDLPNPIAPAIIKKRSQKILQLSLAKREHFFSSLLHQSIPVLFEQQKSGIWSGLTSQYVRVLVKSNDNLKNKIVPVHLEKIEGQNMIGRIF